MMFRGAVVESIGAAIGVASAFGCGGTSGNSGSDPIITGAGGTTMGAGGSAAMSGPLDACGNRLDEPLPDYPKGFHVVGDHIEDGAGSRVTLHGVNRSGSEYMCVQQNAIFEGFCDEASTLAITKWNVNAVRIPLNESCWLGINGVPAGLSGPLYKSAITAYVRRLHKHNLIPILELHWTAPGGALASQQMNMPDADHAPAFWSEVAAAFLQDGGVIFEPFNEPVPPGSASTNAANVDAAWACWADGCMMTSQGQMYQAAGMQSLVDAIRSTGSTHLLLLGGIQYSNLLGQWRARQPMDPVGNLAAAWHIYNNNPCATVDCWNGAPADLATTTPIVATEIGELDCGGTFVTPLMQWLDQHGGNYLAWSWNAFGPCVPATNGTRGNAFSLISDYYSGAPNGAEGSYARTFHDHLAAP